MKKFLCPYCPLMFKTKADLRRHMKKWSYDPTIHGHYWNNTHETLTKKELYKLRLVHVGPQERKRRQNQQKDYETSQKTIEEGNS